MKKLLLTLLLFPLFSFANDMELYKKASLLLDNYRGNGKVLNDAYSLINKMSNKDGELYYIGLSRIVMKDAYISGKNYEEEKVEQSIELINEAILKNPYFFDSYIYAIRQHIVMGNLNQAKKLLRKASELDKDNPLLSLRKASIFSKEKNYEKQKFYANKLLEQTDYKPYVISALGNLIDVYMHEGKLEKVEELYLKKISIEPSAWSYYNYGHFLYYEKKRYEDSIKQFKTAYEIMPFSLANKMLGKAYYRRANQLYYDEVYYQDALDYYLLASKHHPSSNVYYGIAMCHYQIGHELKDKEMIEASKEAFLISLKLNPENKRAKKHLLTVNKLLKWIDKNY